MKARGLAASGRMLFRRAAATVRFRGPGTGAAATGAEVGAAEAGVYDVGRDGTGSAGSSSAAAGSMACGSAAFRPFFESRP